MRLYFANPTGQTRRYYFRLDFNDRGEFSEKMRTRSARFVQVESGKQNPLELQHLSQIQTIMDQLSRTGAMGAEELGRLPNQTVPVILQIAKPVTGDQIRFVNAHNMRVLSDQGRKLRQTAAVSANDLVQKSIESTLQKFTVEFEQIDNPNEAPRGGKPLAEGIEIPQDNGQGAPPKVPGPGPRPSEVMMKNSDETSRAFRKRKSAADKAAGFV